jgi:hypothetical protein
MRPRVTPLPSPANVVAFHAGSFCTSPSRAHQHSNSRKNAREIYITAAYNCRSAAARFPAEIFAYADIFFDDRRLFPQHSPPFHTTRSAFSSVQSDRHKQETTDTEQNIY